MQLGTFKLTSGNVIVSDPCYTLGTWCQAQLENVKTGEWIAEIKQSDEGSWGIRNSEIISYHKDFGMPKDFQWHKTNHDIGVDSGQAGFYDRDFYRNNDMVGDIDNSLGFDIEEDGEKFYSLNCDLTCETEMSGGVMEYGAVSTSGYGDGGYNLFVALNDGKIVAMKIVFITEEEICDDCGEVLDYCTCSDEDEEEEE